MSEEIKCPKCSSTQITAQKHGFSAGKAAAGAILTGGVGLLAGFHGSKNIDCVCLSCGAIWNLKKMVEENKRMETQKQIAQFNAWRESFYTAYEQQDFAGAEHIYLSKFQFNGQVPDVHKAYTQQKKNEANGNIAAAVIWIVFMVVMIAIIYWLFG